jgi:hypothetical protein
MASPVELAPSVIQLRGLANIEIETLVFTQAAFRVEIHRWRFAGATHG